MPSLDQKNGREYWRSLDELADTDAFRQRVADEFPAMSGELLDAPSRRKFLKIMAASLAMAGVVGLGGCRRWPVRTINAEARREEGHVPGEKRHYATGMEIGGVGMGLLVASHDGRPVKVEGNELHAASLGSSSAMAQASLLEIYDPYRRSGNPENPMQTLVRRQGGQTAYATWEEFAAAFKPAAGASIKVLAEASSSLTVAAARARLAEKFSNLKWYEYESVSRDNEREGVRLASGQPLRPVYSFASDAVVLTIDADPLFSHPDWVRHSREFSAARRPSSGAMLRLHAIESRYSVTGAIADYRTPVQARKLGAVLKEVVALVRKGGAIEVKKGAKGRDAAIARAARDLLAAKGKAVIIVGDHLPAEMHAVAAAFNAQFGGGAVKFVQTPARPVDKSHAAAIAELGAGLNGNDTLIIIGGNPVYDAPADVKFADAIRKAGVSVHLSNYDDETSEVTTWHLPRAHYLESWGDVRGYDGSVAVAQPLIDPLWSGKSTAEFLAMLAGDATPAREQVQAALASLIPAGRAFESIIHDGVIPSTAYAAAKVDASAWTAKADALAVAAPAGKFEVVILPAPNIYDGRFASNGWLQELPDSLTKTTWDNPAMISLATAKSLGVTHGDVITIKANGVSIDVPITQVPGVADETVVLYAGFGRKKAGYVGSNVGFDISAFRNAASMDYVADAAVTSAGTRHPLANVQDHYLIEPSGLKERARRVGNFIKEATLDEFKANTDGFQREGHGAHKHPLPILNAVGDQQQPAQLWKSPVDYSKGWQWGMSIDLNVCTGCGTCTIACQAENNVPVVGKDQVLKSREMHWIRIDRYWSLEEDEADTVARHMPMMCVQCETAPCEQVCPVAATVHDHEGINNMVYNRCIGTRYCANNCPYKVRRFNYLDYQSLYSVDLRTSKHPKPYLGIPDQQQLDQIDPVRRLVFNPEVTVRMRGVMEKCTYCTQRVQKLKIRTKNQFVKDKSAGREVKLTADAPHIPDEALRYLPACAQACPTRAIVFGNLNDADSLVSKLRNRGEAAGSRTAAQAKDASRSYAVLNELNTRPRTEYMARILNRDEPVAKAEHH